MMATLQKWGNSLAVRIPQSLAGQIDVAEGSAIVLIVRDGELVIRPDRSPKLSLKTLLNDCKRSEQHGETDFGYEVGREIVE
jgi:antitoxin MazE